MTDPAPPLVLLPAVDVVGGQATQLVRGVAGSGKVYGDPLVAARGWQDQGARWLHLVDLDAAFGRGDNRALLAEVVAALEIEVELAGGIRDDESLAAALATGCTRVVIGTAALEDPAWCARIIGDHGHRIVIGLDVRLATDGDHRLAARGWTRDGGLLWEALERLDAAGCARYVVTDIDRDGTLTGPNTELLLDVAARTPAPVVASGGISTLADLTSLAGLTARGIEGAIIGTALYEGAFTLPDALAATGRPPRVIRVVLASASPARLAVLRGAGLDPIVVVSDVDEEQVLAATTTKLAVGKVALLARAKALAVTSRAAALADGGPVVVIGCDSMLEIGGELVGKPHTSEVARERWRALSGATGTLHTGHAVCMLTAGREWTTTVTASSTTVRFAQVSAAEIDAYVATTEPLEVAGAFTLDGYGGWFVDSIDGDPSNVLGISLPLLRTMLGGLGLAVTDLWNVPRPDRHPNQEQR